MNYMYVYTYIVCLLQTEELLWTLSVGTDKQKDRPLNLISHISSAVANKNILQTLTHSMYHITTETVKYNLLYKITFLETLG